MEAVRGATAIVSTKNRLNRLKERGSPSETPVFQAGAGDEIRTHDSLLGKHGLGAPETPMMHAEQLLVS